MKYKLVCIDMDGALLGKNHSISDENIDALKRAYNKGIVIAICTGRLFYSAMQYSSVLNINGPIIASNGTYIRERDSKSELYKNPLTTEEVSIICDILEKNNIKFYYINTFDTAMSKNEFPKDHAYVIANEKFKFEKKIQLIVDDNILKHVKEHSKNVLKVIAIEKENKEKLRKVKEELRKLNMFEVVSSGEENVEIMKKGSSKGKAVKVLAEKLNIKREEIICIGDNENDISMIKYAGLGIAVANGIDDLKNEADYVTDTNLNNGVAKAIHKFILDK